MLGKTINGNKQERSATILLLSFASTSDNNEGWLISRLLPVIRVALTSLGTRLGGKKHGLFTTLKLDFYSLGNVRTFMV
jgi:hypothetical protein